VALLGAGHLGKIHLKCLLELPERFHVVGVYDPDPSALAKAVEVFGVPGFDQPEPLLDLVDAVDIVAPTLSHYDLALMALRRLKHLFIEKPLADAYLQGETRLSALDTWKLSACCTGDRYGGGPR
jgi:predicted dehydrogenase